MPPAPPKQHITATYMSGIFCTAACTAPPIAPPPAADWASVRSLVNVPGDTINPARRIQAKKEARMLCSRGTLLASLHMRSYSVAVVVSSTSTGELVFSLGILDACDRKILGRLPAIIEVITDTKPRTRKEKTGFQKTILRPFLELSKRVIEVVAGNLKRGYNNIDLA